MKFSFKGNASIKIEATLTHSIFSYKSGENKICLAYLRWKNPYIKNDLTRRFEYVCYYLLMFSPVMFS